MKKSIVKSLSAIFAAAMLLPLTFTACSSDDDDDEKITVTLSVASKAITVDSTTKVSANVDSPNFSSDDTSIATVDSDGTVTGIKVGTTKIRTNKGLPWVDSTVEISVKEKSVVYVYVEDRVFFIDKYGPTDYRGVFDGNLLHSSTLANTWDYTNSCTNGNWGCKMVVDENGNVTATKKDGTKASVKTLKYITITGNNFTKKSDSDYYQASVAAGFTIQLTASEESVKWESDNTDVATVSDTGLVTGVAEGLARIYAEKEFDDNYHYTMAMVYIFVNAN